MVVNICLAFAVKGEQGALEQIKEWQTEFDNIILEMQENAKKTT